MQRRFMSPAELENVDQRAIRRLFGPDARWETLTAEQREMVPDSVDAVMAADRTSDETPDER